MLISCKITPNCSTSQLESLISGKHSHLELDRKQKYLNKCVNNELLPQYDMNQSARTLSRKPRSANEISVCRFHYNATRLVQMSGRGHPRPRLILSQRYQPPWCISG